jgi:hypothetical protein
MDNFISPGVGRLTDGGNYHREYSAPGMEKTSVTFLMTLENRKTI